TRRYGVQPIEVLYAVRNAHNASSSLSLHDERFSPTVLLRMRFNPRLVTSTCPLVCGWYAVDSQWVTPYFAMTLENLSLQKWVPRSLMIALGVPNRENKDFRNLTTTRATFVESALSSTHLDK
nr:hypothetical protein [Tanacetum cinerariifolium]